MLRNTNIPEHEYSRTRTLQNTNIPEREYSGTQKFLNTKFRNTNIPEHEYSGTGIFQNTNIPEREYSGARMRKCSKVPLLLPFVQNKKAYILLTITIDAKNEVALSYHSVCGLYFVAVVFVPTILIISAE